LQVSEAIDTRLSCRAYLDKPVPQSTLKVFSRLRSAAPSGGNLQPWIVHVLTGFTAQELIAIIREKRPHPATR